eukprot:768739-Hanusia_phi.AAC.5
MTMMKNLLKKSVSSDSSRNLYTDLHLLKPGIGRRVPGGHVKAGVMEFVSPKCRPKCSKHVGVQEWKNAIFLMMNIAYGNSQVNTFIDMESKMQVTCYLSEKTKADAPIIQKLVEVSRSPVEAEGYEAAPVPLLSPCTGVGETCECRTVRLLLLRALDILEERPQMSDRVSV